MTGKVRTLRVLIGTIVFALASTLVAIPAKAASSFDDVIQLTDATIHCQDSNGIYHSYDLSGQYYDMLYNGNSTFASYMDAARSNGSGWVVNSWVNGGYKNLNIFVTSSAPGSIGFTNSYAYLTAAMRASVDCNGWVNGVPTGFSLNFNTSIALREVAQWDGTSGYKVVYMNAPITYPGGYEGVMAPTRPAAARYVALGDSYSSGEGNLPYDYGSDTGANICHRSSRAYPRLLQAALDLYPMAFAACSGSVSDYIIDRFNQENPEPPQAFYVSDETDLVTISIGGNDVGFPDVMSVCVAASTAQECLDEISIASSRISDPYFESTIEGVLSGIRSLGKASTKVVSVGYPQLFPAYQDISGSCTWGTAVEHAAAPNLVSHRTITEAEIDALRQVHDELNNMIAEAVSNTNDTHVHFVDPTTAFAGHEICSGSDEWINGISLTVSTAELYAGSFHPNTSGQIAYAEVIEEVVGSL